MVSQFLENIDCTEQHLKLDTADIVWYIKQQKNISAISIHKQINLAGRIPETTRSGDPLKRHPITYQTKRVLTSLWLSWNETITQKCKNKKIKSVKIW